MVKVKRVKGKVLERSRSPLLLLSSFTLKKLPLVEGSGLAAAVVGGIEDIPEDDVSDREALTGTGDANALVVADIAFGAGLGQELIAFGLGDGRGRSAGGHLGEAGPVKLPEGEGLGIAVVEDGVGFDAVGDDDEGGGKENLGLGGRVGMGGQKNMTGPVLVTI
jgi:hypothetical protein